MSLVFLSHLELLVYHSQASKPTVVCWQRRVLATVGFLHWQLSHSYNRLSTCFQPVTRRPRAPSIRKKQPESRGQTAKNKSASYRGAVARGWMTWVQIWSAPHQFRKLAWLLVWVSRFTNEARQEEELTLVVASRQGLLHLFPVNFTGNCYHLTLVPVYKD